MGKDRNLPVWLLDIDGVINCTKPDWHQRPSSGQAHALGQEWPMRWAPSLVLEIAAVRAHGLAEIRWSTTWCGHTQQFAELWGLTLADAFPEPVSRYDVPDLKLRAACDVALGERRPLIWTDDQAPLHGPALVEITSVDQPVLIIRPNERFGLTVLDMDKIRRFCVAAQS